MIFPVHVYNVGSSVELSADEKSEVSNLIQKIAKRRQERGGWRRSGLFFGGVLGAPVAKVYLDSVSPQEIREKFDNHSTERDDRIVAVAEMAL